MLQLCDSILSYQHLSFFGGVMEWLVRTYGVNNVVCDGKTYSWPVPGGRGAWGGGGCEGGRGATIPHGRVVSIVRGGGGGIGDGENDDHG
jgi:hypothetical protein